MLILSSITLTFAKNKMLHFPLRVEAMLIGFTLKGNICATVNLQEWTMKAKEVCQALTKHKKSTISTPSTLVSFESE